jgi:hypothetical protein
LARAKAATGGIGMAEEALFGRWLAEIASTAALTPAIRKV